MALHPLPVAKEIYARLNALYPSTMRILRFVISGGTATVVNLGVLFSLTHLFSIWYVFSSAIAFLVAFFVSFTMQKFWTFEDSSREHLQSQAVIYLIIILVGLAVNTSLIYFFVEYGNLHYLAAQLVSGIFIAVMNYFSYKHLVFRDRGEQPGNSMSFASVVYVLVLAGAIILFGFLASYRLPENPPTWLDEGSITQVSINLAQHGVYGIQTAPNQFVPTDFLTTGFPVIYPITASFSLFGVTLLNARIVMALFMTLLCVFSYFLIRALSGRKHALSLFSLFLLVTFAPLYGHGKNVLGEVPGLMFFVASLVAFHYAQRRPDLWLWLLSGTLAGLSMATKPIYLFIIAPSVLLLLFLQRSRFSLKQVVAYALGSTAVLLLWFFIQVGSIGALQQILFAANADNIGLSGHFLSNIKQFVSELQPIYFIGLLGIWWTSLVLRRWNKVEISSVELYAALFSAMNFLLYLASRGFYRYFFPAEVLSLIFLPFALYQVPLKEYRAPFLKVCTVFIAALILFQGYQTFFHSWISEFKDSNRSALLSEHLQDIPENKTVFFYNVPEAVIFLPSQNYYQYLRYGDNVIRGEENLALLFSGTPDFVLVDLKFTDTDKILPRYTEIARFDKYVLYERK